MINFSIYNATMKIILVAILLIGMEVIRQRGTRHFLEHCNISAVDGMSQDVFIGFIGELYKRLGYSVSIPNPNDKPNYDLVVKKSGKSFKVKCIHSQENVTFEQVSTFDNYAPQNKKEHLLIVTNSYFEKKISEHFPKKEIMFKDRGYLLNCLHQVSD